MAELPEENLMVSIRASRFGMLTAVLAAAAAPAISAPDAAAILRKSQLAMANNMYQAVWLMTMDMGLWAQCP